MSDLTERVRAAIEAAAGAQQEEYGFTPAVRDEMAAAAIREVLAAQREAMGLGQQRFGDPEEIDVFLDAFAREHGIEP